MDLEIDVLRVLDDTLGPGGRSAGFTRDPPLLGALPEPGPAAVVAPLGGLEEQSGLLLDDGELDGTAFASLGAPVGSIGERVVA